MTLYEQTIFGPNGSVGVSNCKTRGDAVRAAVRMAIKSGWTPPQWWQFWLPRWPKDCAEEYQRQTAS